MRMCVCAWLVTINVHFYRSIKRKKRQAEEEEEGKDLNEVVLSKVEHNLLIKK